MPQGLIWGPVWGGLWPRTCVGLPAFVVPVGYVLPPLGSEGEAGGENIERVRLPSCLHRLRSLTSEWLLFFCLDRLRSLTSEGLPVRPPFPSQPNFSLPAVYTMTMKSRHRRRENARHGLRARPLVGGAPAGGPARKGIAASAGASLPPPLW